ncbi:MULTISPECIES: M23 family metallopeptidase [unclassified Microbacterium]|uniref:M23 family metallopeptidase n=1 Tax=unclassified Microbacterium TaxID=2609290 RepID=UPI0034478072
MLSPNGTKTLPPITSHFGPRRAPVAGASTFHRGTDFVGYSRIHAVAAGRVVVVGTPPGWAGGGVQVWIQHDGFLSRSMHMVTGSPTVRVGQDVAEGQDLGAMGKTGNVSGVHHHLEIVVNGVQVDPVPFLSTHLAAVSGGASTPKDGFLMSLTDDQQRQMYEALVVGGPTASAYYTPAAIINVLRGETRAQIDAVSRFPGTNWNGFQAIANNQSAILEAIKTLDPSKSADIEAFEQKLRESEARQTAAVTNAVEQSVNELRDTVARALSQSGVATPYEEIRKAVDDAFDEVFLPRQSS